MKLSKYLELQPPLVQKNTSIITPKTLGQNFLLHIDVTTPKYFYPRISPKAATSEDTHVPRITTSPHLLGCIVGYSVSFNDFYVEKKGAYYSINKFMFKEAIKPTSKLIYDVKATDERWLVFHSDSTHKYEPITIGKLLLTETIHKRKADMGVHQLYKGYIWISSDDDVRLDKTGHTVTKGYYRCTVDTSSLTIIDVESTTKREFTEARKNILAMESIDSKFEEWVC